MDIRPNLYQKAAFLYDFDNRDIVKVDIPFYLEYASKYPGDILELACGTGRVSIILAQNGYKVWGIDLSDSMLEQFRIKLSRQPKAVQDNIWIGRYDMSCFRLNRKFSLIIVPFRGFQSLTADEAQRSCLKCVYEHLADEGVFIINTFRPYNKLDETWVYPEKVQWEAVDEKTGNRIIKKHSGKKIDTINQVIYPEMIYQIIEPDGKVSEIRELLELKYYYYDQLKELLESSGFIIKEEFGYYDKSSISDGKELIFVCGKK
ncbi:MAG: class I SAM-dependent methyltransferase [Clostridiaceae bacterium]|nr:class I SAM-dependent methyltransferase [Clostridiaceae bacterium]